MNELITQQLPLVDAGLASRQGRRTSQSGKAVPAVAETDKSRTQADAAEKRDASAEDMKKLPEVVDELNSRLQEMQRSLRFTVDDDSGRIVVKVIDLDTDKVIRQIPSEEMMTIIRNAGENQSLLINEEA